jgi:hypothetical protein
MLTELTSARVVAALADDLRGDLLLAALMAEGRLIVLGERGDLVLVKVDPAAYREKARVHLPDGPCWAPPAPAR